MNLLVAGVLLALAFLALAYPFFDPRRGVVALSGQGRLPDLLAERDGLYATLRDLDLDYELGKLDRKDYQDRREQYLMRAGAVLQQIDSLGSAARSSSRGDEIEREVRALRRSLASRRSVDSSREKRVCPNCGQSAAEDDRYCRKCGQELSLRSR